MLYVAQYRKEAETCRGQAAREKNAAAKDMLINLAKQWDLLACEREKLVTQGKLKEGPRGTA